MSKLTLQVEMPVNCRDERGEYEDIGIVSLPAKHEVCPRCEGRGSHTNPNIDGNGISPEEFQEDPEFRENYFEGLYDITCQECDGARVIKVPDEKQCDPAILKRYYEHLKEVAEQEREDRVTAYWESGGSEGSRY